MYTNFTNGKESVQLNIQIDTQKSVQEHQFCKPDEKDFSNLYI